MDATAVTAGDAGNERRGTRVDEAIPERGPAAYAAELIGTFMLVLVVSTVVSLYVTPPVSQGPGAPVVQPFIDFSVIGLVHVFALFMLIQTLAIVSGAHFNPAVTVALGAIRQIRWIDAAIYIVCQLAGAVLGAVVVKLLLKDVGNAVNFGAPDVTSRLNDSIFKGMVVEAIGTFFLVWAIVGVAVNSRAAKNWAGLVIGGTLGLMVMLFAPLTGGSFNPARAFGPALVAGKGAWHGADQFLIVYCLGPVVGALLAAAIYHYMFILPGKKGAEGLGPVG
ncbi:MAG: aquaporin-4 [Thermoleophilaceae bacterium]|jgi:MIP family channel proteins|nr:aquaporin-4 [Thermoleophilaceae bacterium]